MRHSGAICSTSSWPPRCTRTESCVPGISCPWATVIFVNALRGIYQTPRAPRQAPGADVFTRAVPLPALPQELLHVAALQLLELHAAVDPLQALPQGTFGARRAVIGKKLFDVIAHLDRAESGQGGNGPTSAKAGDLLRQRIPVGFEVVPCDLTRRRLNQQRRKQ